LEKPVNALCAGKFTRFSIGDFAAIGVARISLGSAMARVTHKAIMDCGQEMFEKGDFALLEGAASGSIIDSMLLDGIDKN